MMLALAETIGSTLKERRLTLATAESCTGGGLGYWITQVPGSSAWFERGFITYHNQAKIEMLAVSPETLSQFGAVSEPIAREMAGGALQFSHADISMAITGIAGPDGGSTEKPVGTVWIAWAKRGGPMKTEMTIFSGNRHAIREQAIQMALEGLLNFIDTFHQ